MFRTLQKISSDCWIQGAFDFLQRASLGLDNVTRYVQNCKDAYGGESQVHRADSKLIYDAQEVEPNHEIRYLFKKVGIMFHNKKWSDYVAHRWQDQESVTQA